MRERVSRFGKVSMRGLLYAKPAPRKRRDSRDRGSCPLSTHCGQEPECGITFSWHGHAFADATPPKRMNMHSRWNEEISHQFSGDLAQRVYSSRLLGQDTSLVLHGGGNTSVKTRVTNIFGEDEEVIFVKGSGWDLETIEAEGFAPCRMKDLLRLAELETLSDPQMAVELQKSKIDPSAPPPSVEAILHAI